MVNNKIYFLSLCLSFLTFCSLILPSSKPTELLIHQTVIEGRDLITFLSVKDSAGNLIGEYSVIHTGLQGEEVISGKETLENAQESLKNAIFIQHEELVENYVSKSYSTLSAWSEFLLLFNRTLL